MAPSIPNKKISSTTYHSLLTSSEVMALIGWVQPIKDGQMILVLSLAFSVNDILPWDCVSDSSFKASSSETNNILYSNQSEITKKNSLKKSDTTAKLW